MDGERWKHADEQVDRIASLLDEALDSPAFDELRTELSKLGAQLGQDLTVSLTCILDVSCDARKAALPLLSTGISTNSDGETYRTWNDSSPQRYIVDGDIRVVPHDRCPNCWEAWDFKWDQRHCPHCDTALGVDCKVLLDSDICPHCEKGKVSMDRPTCDQCGFRIDPTCVVWG